MLYLLVDNRSLAKNIKILQNLQKNNNHNSNEEMNNNIRLPEKYKAKIEKFIDLFGAASFL